ncbi:MAG TPA: hypothetical protein VF112_07215 [Candidatus Dormibacteraeota bacterium]
MAYVTLAGLIVLLLFGLVQWTGQVRRNLDAARPYRHGDDPEWDCSTERRLRLRR